MDSSSPSSSSPMALFQVYLRLRPHQSPNTEQFLEVENESGEYPTHITMKPTSSDQRKRAVERFSFTRVFQEDATQLDLLKGIELPSLVQGVLAPEGQHGRDGLLATLGVTGSGKSHTMLGTKEQRGLTQMSLALLFKTLQTRVVDPGQPEVLEELAATDISEAHLVSALDFLDSVYSGNDQSSRSRFQTPMKVSTAQHVGHGHSPWRSPLSPLRSLYKSIPPPEPASRLPRPARDRSPKPQNKLLLRGFIRAPKNETKTRNGQDVNVNTMYTSAISQPKKAFPRASNLPQNPRVDDIEIESDETAEYAIIVSMYEVYNNGIFDLFTNNAVGPRMANKERTRRPLLFKPTEYSQDRKVVAGLKKVVCGSFEEALLVMNAGLAERRVAGTKSNASSSRSHGFFCIEVKKRQNNSNWTSEWAGNTLTIADLAGSERADLAKTAGSTLAEAGKINESLMYLGQCMQMQSDNSNSNTEPSLVPYRSCKLTEILFSNDFQQPRSGARRQANHRQKAIMIVTADPKGDFNATSQILRYSALAREVTVPRIASTSSTIIYPSLGHGRTSPNGNQSALNASTAQHLDEITRLQTELQIIQLRLQEETARRKAVEESLAKVARQKTETSEEVEARIRAECMDEAEARLQREYDRWSIAAEAERCKQEEYLDGKVGILSRATADDGGFEIYEDTDQQRVASLEEENNALRQQVSGLQSELRRTRNGTGDVTKTPSRKVKTLASRRWVPDDGENVVENDRI